MCMHDAKDTCLKLRRERKLIALGDVMPREGILTPLLFLRMPMRSLMFCGSTWPFPVVQRLVRRFRSERWRYPIRAVIRMRKTKVRTTPVRSQQCECQQGERDNRANQTNVRRQVCEGQECECDRTKLRNDRRLSHRRPIIFKSAVFACLAFPLYLQAKLLACVRLRWPGSTTTWHDNSIIGSAEALRILCVRCARGEREREREIQGEREWDGSDVTFVARNLAMNFAPFLAKTLKLAMNLLLSLPKIFTLVLAKSLHFSLPKIAPQLGPSWRALRSHFPLPKTLRSSKQFAFFVLLLSNGVTGDRSTETNDRICAAPTFFSLKKLIKSRPKTIGNRKRDCAWGCTRRINTTSENLQIEKHKSVRWA